MTLKDMDCVTMRDNIRYVHNTIIPYWETRLCNTNKGVLYSPVSPDIRVPETSGYSRESPAENEDVVAAPSAARHWRTLPFSCTCQVHDNPQRQINGQGSKYIPEK